MLRSLAILLVIVALAAVGAYFLAGRAQGPAIEIVRPVRLVGARGTVEVLVGTPGGRLDAVEISIEQGDERVPLFALSDAPQGSVEQPEADRVRITTSYERQRLGALRPGSGRLVVRASRPVLFGLRRAVREEAREVELRFQPPRLNVLSTHHYLNHGGSELVLYRVDPPDVESGVRVAEVTYRGYPVSDAGVAGVDPAMKVAFFALLHDQDLESPIELFARDEAGNEARATFDHRVFPKNFRRSRIELDDRFLGHVVREIVSHSEEARELTQDLADDDLLGRFLKINGDLRRKNAETLDTIGQRTATRLLWSGPFVQLGNSQVEAGFADYRTYVYRDKEVDQQVHLGFDLAVTANVPVRAANRGTVVWADYLGIYGNCIVIDHGMGLQSLYGHLSSIGVSEGSVVAKNQEIGRSGMTGLAGGDHLHFTMLLGGRPVSPVEWWDPHWIEDRIVRKLKEAGTR